MWRQWCVHCLYNCVTPDTTVNVMWTMMHNNSSHCMSPPIWQIIHRNVSEISIVSSWALTDVFHCEYQLWCQWISPFSSSLFTNSYLQGFLMSEPVCRLRAAADCLKISPITSSSSNSCRWLNGLSENLLRSQVLFYASVKDSWHFTVILLSSLEIYINIILQNDSKFFNFTIKLLQRLQGSQMHNKTF